MDSEDKNQETHLENYEDRYSKLKSESDRLSYQLKKTEEENYAKTLQLASQRQLIESLQEKMSDSKLTKPSPAPKPDESQELQKQIKDLTSRCQILEQINEETVKNTQKDIEIWKNEAETARKQMRKIEDELYLSKKKTAELEEYEEKHKKIAVEKEKLLISLENLSKLNKELEEKGKKDKEQFLQLTEVVQNNVNEEELRKVKEEFWEIKKKFDGMAEELDRRKKDLDKAEGEVLGIRQEKSVIEEKMKSANEKIEELKGKILEKDKNLEAKNAEINKTQQESLQFFEQHIVSFTINVVVDEIAEKPEINSEEHEKNLQELKENYNRVLTENQELKTSIETLKLSHKSSLAEAENSYSAKFQDQENRLKTLANNEQIEAEKIKKYKKDLKTLKNTLKLAEETIQQKDLSIHSLTQEIQSTKKQLSHLQEDSSSYSSIISQLNSEKLSIENSSKQKDLKLKSLSSKVQFLESQIQDKNKEVLMKENELINADRQIDILKKKINSSHTRIKQIASEQIDSQKKKIDSYESEIKMLKDMLKSVQSELKYKQQEVLKLKKPSPRKKDLVEESPLGLVKGKNYQQEPEHKFIVESIKESPFKKHSLNIFKAKSPFRVNSKKALVQDDVPNLLRHIVKGYLTSYVLCEKEKKELMKIFSDLDQGRRGILDKSIVYEKCEEAMLDTNLLGIYPKEVDYKDFLDVNYHNQLQQIHRDLDINFSQILPGSISISELRLLKQSLRPLHRQIWDVIVDRIGSEFPKEVDLLMVKQVLAQAQISF